MFIETICILHGEILNMQYHENRMQQTAMNFGFHVPPIPNLISLLPSRLHRSKVKCKIIYHKCIEDVSFEEYVPKNITSLKLIEDSSVDYSFKLADRKVLNNLLMQKGGCDDILITRNGFITDTSYSNVLFSRKGKYFTPEKPILNGTKRQKLLSEDIVLERAIHRDALLEYEYIHLINSMLDIEDGVFIPSLNVVY